MILEVRGGLDKLIEAAVPFGIEDINTLPVTLEEIFLAFYNHQNDKAEVPHAYSPQT